LWLLVAHYLALAVVLVRDMAVLVVVQLLFLLTKLLSWLPEVEVDTEKVPEPSISVAVVVEEMRLALPV
jgi:hypothetical protein